MLQQITFRSILDRCSTNCALNFYTFNMEVAVWKVLFEVIRLHPCKTAIQSKLLTQSPVLGLSHLWNKHWDVNCEVQQIWTNIRNRVLSVRRDWKWAKWLKWKGWGDIDTGWRRQVLMKLCFTLLIDIAMQWWLGVTSLKFIFVLVLKTIHHADSWYKGSSCRQCCVVITEVRKVVSLIPHSLLSPKNIWQGQAPGNDFL